MNVFLDANILVSVLNKEYPVFTFTSRILSLAGKKDFQFYTSPLCLAIAFYFASKKHKEVLAKQKIAVLCQNILIAGNTSDAVQKTLQTKSIHDFEDGLEYYAAIEQRCDCIITEDKNDFYFSEIDVLNSQDFYLKYMNTPTQIIS